MIGRKKYSLQAEIDLLFEKIRDISDLRVTVATPGWQQVRQTMTDWVVSYDTSIIALAANPEKYKQELITKYALRTICQGLLDAMETTLAQEKRIANDIHKKETIRDAALLTKVG